MLAVPSSHHRCSLAIVETHFNHVHWKKGRMSLRMRGGDWLFRKDYLVQCSSGFPVPDYCEQPCAINLDLAEHSAVLGY